MPSGSSLVTLALPRTSVNASVRASAVAPAPRSRVAAWPPSAAIPTSRCSVETYSSSSWRARLAAVLITARSCREVSGALVLAPCIRGSRSIWSPASFAMSAGSAPTARSSGAAVPSACSSSAASRCSGSTWGLPFAAAFLIATESASWLFRVSLSSMGLFNPP